MVFLGKSQHADGVEDEVQNIFLVKVEESKPSNVEAATNDEDADDLLDML